MTTVQLNATRSLTGRPGALVISLDFELLWGVRDLVRADGGSYREHLLGARTVIPRMLDLFVEYEIAATWATVGLLFAHSGDEAQAAAPRVRPAWSDPRLDAYADWIGPSETDDPLRLAPCLIDAIAATPRQEIGSHSFGHYYPLEPGHDSESFRADLDAAARVAERRGLRLKSLVVPRNQLNPDYLAAMREAGFTSVRANARGWPHRASSNDEFRAPVPRTLRLIDSYAPLSGHQVFDWSEIEVLDGVALIPASHFLRPVSAKLGHLERLRHRRLAGSIERAGRIGGLCHLWWHPHNFGVNQDENLAFLRGLLDVFRDCRERYGMESLSMSDVAAIVNPAMAAAAV